MNKENIIYDMVSNFALELIKILGSEHFQKYKVGEEVYFAGEDYQVYKKKIYSTSVQIDPNGNDLNVYGFCKNCSPGNHLAIYFSEDVLFKTKQQVIDYIINKWKNAT